jgi:hypothetical protein
MNTGDECDTVSAYKAGITVYCVGSPPTTVAHYAGHITEAMDEALNSIRRAARA